MERLATCYARVASALFIAAVPAHGQERIDAAFQPTIAQPEYRAGQGPLVLVDRAHHNFHAGEEQFEQLARLLQSDGLVFRRADGTLPSHPVTDGRRTGERVTEAVI